ncbi:TPA: hypothetical protein QCR51_004905 [Bacillus cereus]|nr:hypothetical protein [Bacillus cereus]
MGLMIPHYLLVGGYSRDKVLRAHEKAKEIFNPEDPKDALVSQLKKVSFFVLCDGSHARWKNQEEYAKARATYIQYLVEWDIPFVEMEAQELIS